MEAGQRLRALARERDAVILAHTYQRPEIQDAADFVGDSYALAVRAAATTNAVILFAGVRFMAETAAVLNPGKTVILPDPAAGCPMADLATGEDIMRARDEDPTLIVVSYVNTSVRVKALSHVCCTSSNAATIVSALPRDREILFVPDRNLGGYVEEKTGRKMRLWHGFCHVHDDLTPAMVHASRARYPDAIFMVHPEARSEVRHLADRVFSTGQMVEFVKTSDASRFIVGTEEGIMHTLRKAAPAKEFHILDEYLRCPNMKRITLEKMIAALEDRGGETITVSPDVAEHAGRALRRMIRITEDASRPRP